VLGKRPGEEASGRGARSSKRARQVRSQGGRGSRVNPVVVPGSTNHGEDASSLPASGLVTGGAVLPHDSSPLQHSKVEHVPNASSPSKWLLVGAKLGECLV